MKINEIFYSIQGESTFAGLPCVFIRVAGCNLRCSYCDTSYTNGSELSIKAILQRVKKYNCKLVEITGGEPLLQPETAELAQQLISDVYRVLVETNGTYDISVLHPLVIRIMDIKCPGSGESDKMDWDNINRLRPRDQVKFVISNRWDFDWAISKLKKHKLIDKTNILFSPVFGLLNPGELAQWILDTKLPVRLQIQLQKYISCK